LELAAEFVVAGDGVHVGIESEYAKCAHVRADRDVSIALFQTISVSRDTPSRSAKSDVEIPRLSRASFSRAASAQICFSTEGEGR
jgi:hypothetical protein